ncbi:dihydroorotase [Aquimarina sediminis]|uniref:dihydroorotase n=1 Tax=Aquimarina sediminis TaxID=2070536 RepID=UPI000CA03377|nr:dihydroorotase [Aquimarina sediminis]
MKNRILLVFLVSLFSGIIYAQNSNSNISIGDVFVIGEASNNSYKHIDFPSANFIIKKGGIANYKNVKGKKVEVVSIKEKKDGGLTATITLASKKLFFNSHKYIKVDITEAIHQKELVRI